VCDRESERDDRDLDFQRDIETERTAVLPTRKTKFTPKCPTPQKWFTVIEFYGFPAFY